MAISDRISAMYDHVGDIYDTLELGGDTTENKNIVNINTEIKREYKDFLAHGTDVLWNNWEKVSGSGETLTLNNTMEGKMKVDLKGNTYQYSTTGKNLIEPKLPTETWKGITITNNGDGSWTLNGTVSEDNCSFRLDQSTHTGTDNLKNYNGTYTLSCNELENNMQLVVMQNGTWQQLLKMQDNNTPVTATFDKENCFIYLFLAQGKTVNNLTIRPQLELGNQASTWEEYTGGQPSPSPDYPQDIQVVSGDNTIKVEGKNLFDVENGVNSNSTSSISGNDLTIITTGNWARTEFTINVIPNQPYVFYCNFENNTGRVKSNFFDGTTDIGGPDSSEASNGTFTKTITPTNNTIKIQLYSNFTSSTTTSSVTYKNIQVEKGSSPTSFVPYRTPQTYPISLGNIELCKIGDYQDKIAKSTGKNLFDKDNMNTRNGYLYNNRFVFKNTFGDKAFILNCQPNTTYTISRSILTTTFRVAYTDNNIPAETGTEQSITCYGQITDNNATSITITTNSSAKYLIVHYGNSNNDTNINQSLATIMVNTGQTALPYEPYGKVWYLNKQIGKVVLDGSETIYLLATLTNVVRFEFSNIINSISASQCYSNYFKWYSNQANNNNFNAVDGEAIHIRDSANSVGIKIRKDICTTLEQFQAWLSTHNIEVYYVLATPTYEEITDTTLLSQLEALAYSYEGTTNISQVNDDLASELDVTALEDI